MRQIENIIFDYGNVIFMIDFALTQKAFVNLGITNPEQLFAHRSQADFFDAYDRGQISSTEFIEHIRKAANKPNLSNQQIEYAWNALLIGVPNEQYHEVLLDVKKRYRTFLLSNNNELHYNWIMEYLKRKFNLDGNSIFFEKDYYSQLMGMRKPEPEIFEFVLDNHSIDPKKTLFIDDSPQHLETAKKLGLHTHLMTPEQSLPDFLQKNGFLS